MARGTVVNTETITLRVFKANTSTWFPEERVTDYLEIVTLTVTGARRKPGFLITSVQGLPACIDNPTRFKKAVLDALTLLVGPVSKTSAYKHLPMRGDG